MATLLLEKIPSNHFLLYAVVAGVFLLAYIVTRTYNIYSTNRPYPGIPLIALPGKTPRDSWYYHGNETIKLGLETTADNEPFQVMTGTGPKIVLRNRYADEVAKHKDLSLVESIRIDFMARYPGFEGVMAPKGGTALARDTINRKLTQSLALITADIVEEAADAIQDIFGESSEWKTTLLMKDVQQLVSRLSSRAFLGKPLCRDQRWLDIAKNYTVHVHLGARDLRGVSSLVRPVKHWFMPNCRALRTDVRDAKALISGEVARREAAANALFAEGKKVPRKADAIAWFVETANERGHELDLADLVYYQLGLTVAAIHTTSEALSRALQHLCENPQYIAPIREEIIRVVGEHGWAKTSLNQLRLMDSFFKESQRHSRGLASLQRAATADIVLSDSCTIKRGTRTILLSSYMDEKNYPEPTKFDAYRFMEKREQYVTVSPQHMGFGLGLHACPGRFFAANELKIALSHLLLKYDWSLDPEKGKSRKFELESAPVWDPTSKLRFKRRKEEIDLGLVTE